MLIKHDIMKPICTGSNLINCIILYVVSKNESINQYPGILLGLKNDSIIVDTLSYFMVTCAYLARRVLIWQKL